MANVMRFNRKKLVSAMAIALGMTLHAGWASAATVASAPTDTVIGRAPVVAPTIENTTRTGQPPVDGDLLTVTPNFTDADQDASTTTYVWKSGTTILTGVTGPTYTLVPGDLGALITAEVTPATDSSITDPALGTMVPVSLQAATVAGDKPISMAIHRGGSPIVGAPIVGDVLTAVPTCVNVCDSNLVFSWEANGSSVGGSGNTYTVLTADQKKPITVSTQDVKSAKAASAPKAATRR